MAGPNGIDLKLRAAFLLAALVIVVALGIAGAIFPDLLYVAIWLMPAVVLAALVSMVLTERRRRRRDAGI